MDTPTERRRQHHVTSNARAPPCACGLRSLVQVGPLSGGPSLCFLMLSHMLRVASPFTRSSASATACWLLWGGTSFSTPAPPLSSPNLPAAKSELSVKPFHAPVSAAKAVDSVC